MASTYTGAGIELIADGEQSGTWGQTTNTNWELIEELATGGVSIALSSTSYTLTTSDGITSTGRHAVITFTGSPGGTCTVTISPDTMQKIYFVKNDSDQTVTLTQGSGSTVDVASNKVGTVFCDGIGSASNVTAISPNSIENLPDLGDVYTSLTTAARALLYWDDSNSRWDAGDIDDVLPDQSSADGKFLTSDGTNASWGTLPAISFGNWSIDQVGTDLVFSYDGTAKVAIDSNGAITTVDDITAFGSL